jgi:hypothetical protein
MWVGLKPKGLLARSARPVLPDAIPGHKKEDIPTVDPTAVLSSWGDFSPHPSAGNVWKLLKIFLVVTVEEGCCFWHQVDRGQRCQ